MFTTSAIILYFNRINIVNSIKLIIIRDEINLKYKVLSYIFECSSYEFYFVV